MNPRTSVSIFWSAVERVGIWMVRDGRALTSWGLPSAMLLWDGFLGNYHWSSDPLELTWQLTIAMLLNRVATVLVLDTADSIFKTT